MTQTVQATTREGVVVGRREGGVCRFSAIPYGQPPVGPLRFQAPQPAHWSGRLDATRPGPVAPQLPSRLRIAVGDFQAPQSEDCLQLTVWTPAADDARRPVVVWLHGGAWQSGGAAIERHSGARLAARGDVVVVAVTYRLAALGWLHAPGAAVNPGLLDQEAAIDWVAGHIADFGGDPERITVMGQSAGGASIAALLARKPRFARAIMQSPWLGNSFREAGRAAAIGRELLAAAGARDLEEARRLPCEAWLRAQQTVAAAHRGERIDGMAFALFCPVLDGDVLPRDYDTLLRAAAGRADVLIGFTGHELSAFNGGRIDDDSVREGDAAFGAPSRAWAQEAAAQGRKAWFYRFDYAPTPSFGACHCIELPFVFGTAEHFADAPMLAGADPDDMDRLTDAVQQAWIAFIRGEAPGWDAWPMVRSLAPR